MARKKKEKSGLSLINALGEMSTLVRFKALQMCIDAVPPVDWGEPVSAALASPLSEYEQAQRVLEISTQWEGSAQRAALAKELSRLVALTPPPKAGDRAELVLPLWGYREEYAFPDRFDPQYRSQGGALRSGHALNDAPLEAGIYLSASRGSFQGLDVGTPGEFGQWFENGRTLTRITTESRERMKRSLSGMVSAALQKTMGDDAWDLISQWTDRNLPNKGSQEEAKAGMNRELMCFMLTTVAWAVEKSESTVQDKEIKAAYKNRNDGGNLKAKTASDYLLTSKDVEVLRQSILFDELCVSEFTAQAELARSGLTEVSITGDKLGWLGRLFGKDALDGSEWNPEAAEYLKRRGCEIFKAAQSQGLPLDFAAANLVIVGVWLGNELSKSEREMFKKHLEKLLLPTSLQDVEKSMKEESLKMIWGRVNRVSKDREINILQSKTSKGDRSKKALKALTDKAQEKAKRLTEELVEDAMCIADSRMGHWAASLGFESIGVELAAGCWDKLNAHDWGKEAAARRFTRDATVSGRIWAALESAATNVGEEAKKEARIALSILGMGTQEVEEFSQKPQAQAFLACAQVWVESKAKDSAENVMGNSQEDDQSGWSRRGEGKTYNVCTLAALMCAFHADAKEVGGGTLSVFSDPKRASECIHALGADYVWSQAVEWVGEHKLNLNDLAEKVDWDMDRALAAVQSHEEAAGRNLKNAVAVATGLGTWGPEGEPKFSKLWSPLDESIRLEGNVRGLLGQDGFAGLVAKIAAWEGWCPRELQGDARTQANAWLGVGKEYAQSKLGIGEASWKWLRSRATPVEQMMSIKQIGAGAYALGSQDDREFKFFGKVASHVSDYRSVEDVMLKDKPLAGFEGSEDKDAAKQLLQSEGPSDDLNRLASKRLKELEQWLDGEITKSSRIGISRRKDLYKDSLRRKFVHMTDMMHVDMDLFDAEASSSEEVDRTEVATPMGMLMTRAIKSGKPMAHAMAAANFVEPFWSHVGSWGNMRESWWNNVFSPAFNGAKLSSVYEVLAQEAAARTQKMDMFLSAILEQAESPKSIDNLEKLGEISDWARAQAGRFWQELPKTFGWKALERGSSTWHEQSAAMRSGTNKIWRPMGLTILEEATGLEVVELCNSRALVEEGNAMSHCVGSYASSCALGEKRIFSVRKNGKRLATLEFAPEGREGLRIAQLKGQCNNAPNLEVREFAERALVRAKEILMKEAVPVIKDEQAVPMVWEIDGFDAQNALASSRANRAAARDKEKTKTPTN